MDDYEAKRSRLRRDGVTGAVIGPTIRGMSGLRRSYQAGEISNSEALEGKKSLMRMRPAATRGTTPAASPVQKSAYTPLPAAEQAPSPSASFLRSGIKPALASGEQLASLFPKTYSPEMVKKRSDANARLTGGFMSPMARQTKARAEQREQGLLRRKEGRAYYEQQQATAHGRELEKIKAAKVTKPEPIDVVKLRTTTKTGSGETSSSASYDHPVVYRGGKEINPATHEPWTPEERGQEEARAIEQRETAIDSAQSVFDKKREGVKFGGYRGSNKAAERTIDAAIKKALPEEILTEEDLDAIRSEMKKGVTLREIIDVLYAAP